MFRTMARRVGVYTSSYNCMRQLWQAMSAGIRQSIRCIISEPHFRDAVSPFNHCRIDMMV